MNTVEPSTERRTRRRRVPASAARALLLGTVIIAASAVPLGVGAAPYDPVPANIDASVLAAPTSGPVVATGRLVDAGGHATTGRIAALAWPAPAYLKTHANAPMPTVGWAAAAADGTFTLRVDPRQVQAIDRAANGVVNLDVYAWSQGRMGETHFSTSAVSTRSQTSLKPVTMPAQRVTLKLGSTVPKGTTNGTNGPGKCGGSTKVSTYSALSEVGTSYPYYYTGDGDTSWMSINTSQSISFGVAVSASGSSWSASGSASDSSSIAFTWAPDIYSRIFEITESYGKYWISCLLEYEYVPITQLGGFPAVSVTWDGFNDDCQLEAEGTWSRSSSSGDSFSLGGGVLISKAIGFNLSISTAYDSDRSLSYKFNTADGGELCGSNTDPAHASQVSEY